MAHLFRSSFRPPPDRDGRHAWALASPERRMKRGIALLPPMTQRKLRCGAGAERLTGCGALERATAAETRSTHRPVADGRHATPWGAVRAVDRVGGHVR